MGRTRNLIALASVAVLAAIAAFIVVMEQDTTTTPVFQAQPMFPKLQDRLNDVIKIEIETKEETFIVERRGDAWTLPSRDNFPADLSVVRRILIELADLQLIEKKTAQAARHKSIGLDDPGEGGEGVMVRVYGGEDLPIAGAIVSSFQPGGGADRLYVRWPAEDQTWIAKGALQLSERAEQWISKDVLTVKRADIKAVDVVPFEGPAYRLSRDSTDNPDFTLATVPEGRKTKPAFSWNTTGFALTSLNISDVRSTTAAWSLDKGLVTYELFDGSVLTFGLADGEAGDLKWLTLVDATAPAPSQAEPGEAPTAEDIPELSGNPAKRVAEIRSRMDGWDFGIPQFKFEQFVKPLEELLEPVNEGAMTVDESVDGLTP